MSLTLDEKRYQLSLLKHVIHSTPNRFHEIVMRIAYTNTYYRTCNSDKFTPEVFPQMIERHGVALELSPERKHLEPFQKNTGLFYVNFIYSFLHYGFTLITSFYNNLVTSSNINRVSETAQCRSIVKNMRISTSRARQFKKA